ncbi:vesicle-trafficking protein SEC22c isoform X2 [Dermochelys coriacea]|uniref:vesicle-trafficking protein SEC22c isoform X2 n=1 Tax=Dermochelys coriacea TaxID=27794 RepID=UPI001CA8A9DA|nr:vesicle-trafficking protein SEC22c isoform X2 [Dermochelys coriacea]
MSMILFACVVRVRDGLPLSASTDFHLNQDFLECRKRLKALSLILAQYPDRGTATGRGFSIHFHSSGDIACMGICTSCCPTVMAFCFLEELQWKFSASYNSTSISLATRPYAFLEFDNIIQKVKYHFNYTSCSQMKNRLEKIQEALKFHPPVLLKLEDMNGMINGHTEVHMGSGRPRGNWKCNSISSFFSSLHFSGLVKYKSVGMENEHPGSEQWPILSNILSPIVASTSEHVTHSSTVWVFVPL